MTRACCCVRVGLTDRLWHIKMHGALLTRGTVDHLYLTIGTGAFRNISDQRLIFEANFRRVNDGLYLVEGYTCFCDR